MCIRDSTKGEGEKSAEDFLVKSERLFYTALIGYIWYEAPAEEMNFTTLLEMINASEAREDDHTTMRRTAMRWAFPRKTTSASTMRFWSARGL